MTGLEIKILNSGYLIQHTEFSTKFRKKFRKPEKVPKNRKKFRKPGISGHTNKTGFENYFYD